MNIRKMIAGAAAVLALAGGTASAAHATSLKPFLESLELTCDDDAIGTSVVVVFKAAGTKPVKKTVRCREFGTFIDKPLIELLKKMRHGRDGTTRLPFTADVQGQRWRFVAKYTYFRGREIPESNFDDYVNICLDKNLHLYARGGQLYCYVQPARLYLVTRP